MGQIAKLKQQLFRWRSDGSEPFTLGQRRIFIVPSRGGLLFAIVLLVMLIGAINYNLALGHALVFLLAGIGLAGMIHTFRNLYGLQVRAGRAEPVFAGELAHFPILLGNDRPTPRLALELAAVPELPVTTAVDAGETQKIAIPLPAEQRGWLSLPRVRLATRYPLGLFTAWSYLLPEMRCLVYPRPIDTPLPPAAAPNEGSARQGDAGQEDFAGFRERQAADSPRHVAWKIDARLAGSAPLYVKQFAGGADAELAFDWALTDPVQPTENRLGILAGWVLAATAQGLRYGLHLPGVVIAPASGEAHYLRCLEALALFRP